MKNKISRIWGVGLVIVLTASLLLAAAPVSAGTLSWGAETIPSTSGKVLQDGASVADIAIADDGTIYAVTGVATDNYCYKSTNGGVSWSKMTQDFSFAPDLVAVAPDDSDVVAVALAATPEVWISKDGGSTWGTLSAITGDVTTADALYDMAISPTAAGVNYLAVAGEDGNVADVWKFNIGAAAPSWEDTADEIGFEGGTEALAVAFSPNFASDYVMTAVSVNGTADDTHFQMWSESSDAWNDTGASFSSYPVEIKNGSNSIEDTTGAAIALSPDYLGSDDTMRVAFVGLTTSTSAYGGVYRLKNTTDKVIDDGINIYSISYDGTNLVAGATDDHNVRRSDDPLATTPSFSSAGTYKRPGMTSAKPVVVAWNGADVVAGTSGTGSAFSVSGDNGKSFNDISLVDAANMGTMLDVAVSADGSTVYMLANDGNALSLWKMASSWKRVLALGADDGYILRVAPDDPDTVYVAKTGAAAKSIYYSSDGGETKWFARTTRAFIQDLTVEGDGDVAYMAVYNAATVSKTTNTGFTWGTAKATGVTGNINMISSLSEDNLIVGSASGYVAWSTDGNSNWSANSVQLNGAGPTQVTASGLADGDFIYASAKSADATASLVERWEMGQSGTTWKDISATFVGDNYSATGISLTEGVLYVLTETSTADNNSAVIRTLSPSSAEPSSGMWSSVASADEAFSATPTALRVSAGKLWTVDKDLPKLWSYSDTLSTAGPALVTPSHGAEVQINPVSGSAYTQAFSWERPSKATIYQLRFALDYDFTEVVKTVTTASTTDDPIAEVVGPGATNALAFMPNITYYWKVRVAQAGPVFSPWSATRMFTIGALPEIQPPVEIIIPPAPPAPQIVLPPTPAPVPAPEIIFQTPPPPPDIIIPPAPAPPAPITPAFIWAIVIIGAILVIAVIVLIVRTRRVA